MPIGPSDILSTIQNGVTAVNNLAERVRTIFPQVTAVSTAVVPPGPITFSSSQAAAFLTVVTSSGGTYYVPLY